MSRRCAAAMVWSLALSAGASSAQVAPPAAQPYVGVVASPCTELPSAPPAVTAYLAQAAHTRAAHQEPAAPSAEQLALYADWQRVLLASDYAGLCHYHEANAKLPKTAPHRVVFFGDSITELWGQNAPELFQGDVINRGVSGQTTEQMVARFRADVIDLQPTVVQILAGTNDIAGNTGPTTLAWIESNIMTMVDLARAHHITVILGAVPPAARFGWRPEIAPKEPIATYNRWLKDFATRNRIAFIDYHAALDDGSGGIRSGWSNDGVHPNATGYAVLTSLAQKALTAIRKR